MPLFYIVDIKIYIYILMLIDNQSGVRERERKLSFVKVEMSVIAFYYYNCQGINFDYASFSLSFALFGTRQEI